MWTINEKQYINEDGVKYTGYGVTFGEFTIEDITPSLSAITRFVDALNRYEASQVHIEELVENFLAE
ncbi:MAG: hypothetical protein ACI4WS_06730 [Oscillospiraceae bacterium]